MQLIGNSVSHDTPQSFQAVAPADLLALLVAATGVTDRHFVTPNSPSRHFGRNLRFKSKTVLLQRGDNLFQYIAPKDLVAALHIGQIQIRKTIRKCGQEPVTQVVQHAVCVTV